MKKKPQKIEIKGGYRRIQKGISYWELGPGVRFFPTKFYCDVMGVSPQWLSEVCNQLQIPYFFSGKRSYIRYETFLKAFAFISELGQPNFAGPGSDQKFGAATRKKAVVTKLDLEKFFESEDRIIKTIRIGARIHGKEVSTDVEINLRKAFRDFKNSTLQLATVQPNE